MANTKRTTNAAAKATPSEEDALLKIRTAALQYIRNPERGADSAAQLRMMGAAQERRENPLGRLTNQDIRQVSHRLYDVVHSLRSMHRLAIEAHDSGCVEAYLLAVEEMSRSSARGVDACIERLEGSPAVGCFETEIDSH
jgi:hypothetical protein